MARQIAVLGQDDELLRSERQLRAEGFCWIAGVDEAGRGPLAGSVVAAAVILPADVESLPGVFDSKQLTEAEREELFEELHALPGIKISVASATAEEIDELNILRATHLAMRRAVAGLKEADFVLVDGLPVQFTLPSRNIIKGDAKSASIAAASIIAKVTRDREMLQYDAEYPQYGFARHKGYGTREHLDALKKFGPSPIHRKSFRPVYELLPDTPVQGTLDF
ncbi:MAG: ribonuclease HII [Lentisphaeria bacterium]|nr:ribonuclease HII [Lentisphaeria bacterium]